MDKEKRDLVPLKESVNIVIDLLFLLVTQGFESGETRSSSGGDAIGMVSGRAWSRSKRSGKVFEESPK